MKEKIIMKKRIVWLFYFLKGKYNILLNKIGLSKFSKHKYIDKFILDPEEANRKIYDWINEGKPRMIARYGSNEAYATAEAIGMSLGIKKNIRSEIVTSINRNAGVFPYGEEMAFKFGMYMKDVSYEVDMLAYWKTFMQDYLINNVCRKDIYITHLSNLEPFCFENPWTMALKGKKVLVIHPFANSIKSQYENRKLLFDNENILPEFELNVLKAVQTIAYEKDDRFDDWFQALEYMYNEAMKFEFDVAIIGCGAYGFPLAAKLKKEGKVAIHLGGMTQLLFGIKGKRWDNDPVVSKLYNEYWIRPHDSDTPVRANMIEGGCYW